MNDRPASPLAHLASQRAALLRTIRWASLAGVLTLAVVVSLVLAVIWKAQHSTHEAVRADAEANRAEQALAAAAAQLWKSRLNEARAIRLAKAPDARQRSTALLVALARTPDLTASQQLELRTEAIALFALLDLAAPTNDVLGDLDACAATGVYARRWAGPAVEVRSFAHDHLVARRAGPATNGATLFSPRGRHAATTFATEPPTLLLWRLTDSSAPSAHRVSEATLHGAGGVAFSPAEHLVALRTLDEWEVRDLHDHALVRRRGPAESVAFSPDDRWLACAEGTALQIEDARTGAVWLREDLGLAVTQLTWRSSGDVLGLATTDGAVVLADLPPPGAVQPLRLRPTEGHATTVVYAEFVPDGSALVTTSWDGFSVFWDALSGRRLLTESRQFVTGLAREPLRALVTRPFPTRTALANLEPRLGFRLVAALPARPRPPTGLAVNADGRWLAVDNGRFTTLFDADTGRELAHFRGTSPAFSADGRTLWTCDEDQVLRFTPGQAPAPASPDDEQILFRTPSGARANSLTLAPDGQTLVVCATDHAVLLVDAATGERRREIAVRAHYARLAADGETLVTQLHNGPAQLVRLDSSHPPTSLGTHLNTHLDPTGRWLGCATETQIRLSERDASGQFSPRHQVPVAAGAGAPPPLAFSPDGNLLAVVFDRFEVRLFHTRTGQLLAGLNAPFPAQISGVAALAFSREGRELFAAKQDGEVVAWNLPALRRGLAPLGLDWETAPPPGKTPASPARWPPTRAWNIWAAASGLAGTAALLAGLIVFTLQRRMLAAYERAAAVAEAQQRDLLEAQLALAQSQKLEALGTLAAGMAHDFNNLLSVIRMSNHFVTEALQPQGVPRENLEAIERAVTQGRDLVRSMLGYARRADDASTEFSLTRVVSDTMGMLSRQFLSGLTLSLELDPHCPPVLGSAARLEQLLLNLVINAAEAMQGRGRINLRAHCPDTLPRDLVLAPTTAAKYVELSVQDEGPGIAPDHLPHIFEPFFTTKTGGTQPGTGLGLSVVHTLARQNGWGLAVEAPPGKGASFQVLLPAAPPGVSPHFLNSRVKSED